MMKLGQLVTAEATRDAVHIAVVPVTAAVVIIPGQRVNKDGLPLGELVGIVDPFLPDVVRPGQRFYLCLYPESVTGMTHHWTHPAFDGSHEPAEPPPGRAASMKWIADFAPTFGLTYDGLMEAARRRLEFDEHIIEQGSDGWRDEFYEQAETFWRHYEVVTGTKVTEDKQTANPFCCNC